MLAIARSDHVRCALSREDIDRSQRTPPDDFQRASVIPVRDLDDANLINRMAHGAFLRERCDWQSLVAGLQPVPIGHQFGLMQFSPCLD